MGKIEPTLGHHLDQITKAEFVAQIPAHAQNNHLTIKMPPRKQLLNTDQPAYRQSSIPKDYLSRRHLAICTRACLASRGVYRVRIIVLDPNKQPVNDAHVSSSTGGELKKVSENWEFDLAPEAKPADGK